MIEMPLLQHRFRLIFHREQNSEVYAPNASLYSMPNYVVSSNFDLVNRTLLIIFRETISPFSSIYLNDAINGLEYVRLEDMDVGNSKVLIKREFETLTPMSHLSRRDYKSTETVTHEVLYKFETYKLSIQNN